jgi:type I restriction enzyme S subunit
MDVIEANANGSTFQEISKKNLRPITVVVPSKPVLNRSMTIMYPHCERVVLNIGESRTLAALRDHLLPKLISDELRVKDAEQFIERAVQ